MLRRQATRSRRSILRPRFSSQVLSSPSPAEQARPVDLVGEIGRPPAPAGRIGRPAEDADDVGAQRAEIGLVVPCADARALHVQLDAIDIVGLQRRHDQSCLLAQLIRVGALLQAARIVEPSLRNLAAGQLARPGYGGEDDVHGHGKARFVVVLAHRAARQIAFVAEPVERADLAALQPAAAARHLVAIELAVHAIDDADQLDAGAGEVEKSRRQAVGIVAAELAVARGSNADRRAPCCAPARRP